MSYEVIGKLVAKYPVTNKTETFKVREFVIETTSEGNGKFVNYVKMQCVQDKTTLPDRFNIGDEVKVQFNLKGSRRDKDGVVSYFTNLDAWRMEGVKMSQDNTPTETNFNDIPPSNEVDELPF